jgi:exodeoxyribonuclease III
MTRIISANLNGIRSAHTKGFFNWMISTQADVICVQEIKAQINDLSPEHTHPTGYTGHFMSAEKKGYSGVGLYSKEKPLNIEYGFNNPEFDAEGRMITAEFQNMIVSSIYFPAAAKNDKPQNSDF